MTITNLTEIRIIAASTPLLFSPSLAMAHWGHLGEVAGHGHLVAAGLAGVIGLAIAGLAATKSSDAGSDSDEVEEAVADEAAVTGDKAHA